MMASAKHNLRLSFFTVRHYLGLCQPSQLQDYVHCRITFYLIPYSTVLEVSICGFVMASLADLIVFCDPYQNFSFCPYLTEKVS